MAGNSRRYGALLWAPPGPSLAAGRPKKREKRPQAPQRPERTLFVKGCVLGGFARYATSEGQRRTEREVVEHPLQRHIATGNDLATVLHDLACEVDACPSVSLRAGL
jgi:hypothetical protein